MTASLVVFVGGGAREIVMFQSKTTDYIYGGGGVRLGKVAVLLPRKERTPLPKTRTICAPLLCSLLAQAWYRSMCVD
jgi:hypothetical protein